jgi:GNAT superfamily N-acetyltransferase
VAEVNGAVVGFMFGDLRKGEFGIEEPSGWVERFGIDPDFRGKDLGRRLFEAMCAHFRAEGASRARTLVDVHDTSLTGFLAAIGLTPSPLQALEIKL